MCELAKHLNGARWLAVVGTFDPLTLQHAERLAEFGTRGKSILAVVERGERSLLPVQARAILVAALRSVKLVAIGEANDLRGYRQLEIVTDDEGERRRSAGFAEHVRGRQRAK